MEGEVAPCPDDSGPTRYQIDLLRQMGLLTRFQVFNFFHIFTRSSSSNEVKLPIIDSKIENL